jgi:hypothetical protein
MPHQPAPVGPSTTARQYARSAGSTVKQIEDPGDKFTFQWLYYGAGVVLRKEGVVGLFRNLQRAIIEQQAAIVQPSIAERGANIGVSCSQSFQLLFYVCLRLSGWEGGKRHILYSVAALLRTRL